MSEPSHNKFSGMLDSSNEIPMSADNNEGVEDSQAMICDNEETKVFNDMVENVFYFTINPEIMNDFDTKKQLVYLQDLAETLKPSIYLDLETLEQALFERLLLSKPELQVIPKVPNAISSHVVQTQVFTYLFDAMRNLQTYESSNSEIIIKSVKKMKELIFRNTVTALKQPALFERQLFDDQLIQILKQIDPLCAKFFEEVINALMAEDTEVGHNILYALTVPILVKLYLEIVDCNVINLPLYILPAIKIFASNKHLAPILMTTCEPKTKVTGKRYHDSVIGALLCLSVLPKDSASKFMYFDDPLDMSANSVIETSLWNSTSYLIDNLHKIFMVLLKGGPEIKNRILQWIGNCLTYNASRGKLAIEEGMLFDTFASDAFMINLGAVLLKLCQPFCNYQDDPKFLKIDPTYPAVMPKEFGDKGVHYSMYKDTCLLPPPQNENDQSMPRLKAESYNFVTECFFMTQSCIDLGIRICADKLARIGQSVGRVRSAQRERVGKYLSYRCALLEPTMLSNLQRMQAMSCTWLMQVAARPSPAEPLASYAPGELVPIELPLTVPAPDTLRCVPELVLENMVCVITTSRRAEADTFGASSSGPDSVSILAPAMTVVLAFMGDSTRTYNPHLRAGLAECLEAMLPNQDTEDNLPLGSLSSLYRQQLFKEHPHRLQLVPNILEVFVSIEMTGQSVQFEQKFNYRRPMYAALDYLWTLEEHRDVFTRLANEAESNMEAVHPPIFLRFINLLMNDAVFLLDEALANMALIRTLQARRAAPEWDELPSQERQGVTSTLAQTGMMARFDNLLGRDTVRALVKLTQHAPHVFCHPTLVDRIASTLNYFLLHLVGPNKKNFKVKDMKEFQFEPGNTVMDICIIYMQLADNERFCAAIADDGRSYSPQLFGQALAVLARIGGGHLMGPLQTLEVRVAEAAAKKLIDEEALGSAPEEFLDPIMSTLMMDPVILPSSKVNIDRTTIARHLLSDQSDPFNRSPLSMDLVVSNTELKERIHTWVAEQRGKMANKDT